MVGGRTWNIVQWCSCVITKYCKVFLSVRTPGLITQTFHLLNHLGKNMSRLKGTSALNALHTNNPIEVLKLCTVTRLKNMQGTRMGWCLVEIDYEQKHTGRRRVEGTNFLQAFITQGYHAWKRTEMFGRNLYELSVLMTKDWPIFGE